MKYTNRHIRRRAEKARKRHREGHAVDYSKDIIRQLDPTVSAKEASRLISIAAEERDPVFKALTEKADRTNAEIQYIVKHDRTRFLIGDEVGFAQKWDAIIDARLTEMSVIELERESQGVTDSRPKVSTGEVMEA